MIFNNSYENLELLIVEDTNFNGQRHLILLTTKHNQMVHNNDIPAKRWITGDYQISATYLTGPLAFASGKLVSLMGGNIDWHNSVRITNGEVKIQIPELRGLKIGSYLLNRIVTWAKTLEPERSVQQITLSDVDAANILNRGRRNRLFQKFGIRFEFLDNAPEAVGYSASDMTIADLLSFPNTEWPNIRLCRNLAPLHRFLEEHEYLRKKAHHSFREAAIYRRQLSRIHLLLEQTKKYAKVMINGPLLIAGCLFGILIGMLFSGGANYHLGHGFSRWLNLI